MPFYTEQPVEQREAYKRMLRILGMMSSLYSISDSPYLVSRAQENCFCKCFEAENLARDDTAADAIKGNIGIGLKTWTTTDNQKVAEFGRLRPEYEHLDGLELVKKIAEYRNKRMRMQIKGKGLNGLIYHIVKRVPGTMQIIEYPYDYIAIDNIKVDERRGNANNTYFSDGNHTYHFSKSKNTLYMIFENMKVLDTVEVDILTDPFDFLEGMMGDAVSEADLIPSEAGKPLLADNQLCLRLYSEDRAHKKFIPPKSGLNQWNASGRRRDPDEIYIPFPAEDRKRNVGFFPPRDSCFTLILPDGQSTQAKVCQQDSKAIMSNPNKFLGHWLLRDVLGLQENEILTYEKLIMFGVDSVVFTKKRDDVYMIDFKPVDTYDKIYHPERFEDDGEDTTE